jgi:hypothetical protein
MTLLWGIASARQIDAPSITRMQTAQETRVAIRGLRCW